MVIKDAILDVRGKGLEIGTFKIRSTESEINFNNRNPVGFIYDCFAD